jgi:hypothetical protein
MCVPVQTCKTTARRITTLATGLSGFYLNASARRVIARPCHQRFRSSETAAPRKPGCSLHCFGISGPSPSGLRTFARWRSAPQVKSLRRRTGRFRIRSVCWPRWKMSPAYCKSVLAHEHRIGLDGSTAEPIDTKAKDLAAKQLERLAARETAKAAVPVPMKRKSAERQPSTRSGF